MLDLLVFREMFFVLYLFLSLLTRSCVVCAVDYVEHRKFLLKTFLLNDVSFEFSVFVLSGVTNWSIEHFSFRVKVLLFTGFITFCYLFSCGRWTSRIFLWSSIFSRFLFNWLSFSPFFSLIFQIFFWDSSYFSTLKRVTKGQWCRELDFIPFNQVLIHILFAWLLLFFH